MSKAQIIDHEGRPTFVVLPYEEYERMQARLEDLEDVQAFDEAEVQRGETFPHAVAKRIAGGESPVRVFRDQRALSQAELSRRAGLSKSYVAKIERGGGGSVQAFQALARALDLTIDDLV